MQVTAGSVTDRGGFCRLMEQAWRGWPGWALCSSAWQMQQLLQGARLLGPGVIRPLCASRSRTRQVMTVTAAHELVCGVAWPPGSVLTSYLDSDPTSRTSSPLGMIKCVT